MPGILALRGSCWKIHAQGSDTKMYLRPLYVSVSRGVVARSAAAPGPAGTGCRNPTGVARRVPLHGQICLRASARRCFPRSAPATARFADISPAATRARRDRGQGSVERQTVARRCTAAGVNHVVVDLRRLQKFVPVPWAASIHIHRSQLLELLEHPLLHELAEATAGAPRAALSSPSQKTSDDREEQPAAPEPFVATRYMRTGRIVFHQHAHRRGRPSAHGAPRPSGCFWTIFSNMRSPVS